MTVLELLIVNVFDWMCLLIIPQSRVKWGQMYLTYFASRNRVHNRHKKGGKCRLKRQKQETVTILNDTRVILDDYVEVIIFKRNIIT